MHILYVVNDLNYFRAHREQTALHMKAAGYKISVASGMDSDDLPDGWDSQIALVPLQLNRHRLAPLDDVLLFFKLREIIQKNAPDVVHCFTIKPIIFAGLACALSAIKPRLIWTFAGLGKVFENSESFYKNLRRSAISRILGVVANRTKAIATFENPLDRQIIVAAGVIEPKSAYVIMGAGLDLRHYAPAAKNDLSIKDGLTFLMATRLIGEKGVGTYIEAARVIKQSGGKAKFLLAGIWDESNPDAIDAKLIDTAIANGDIEFVGSISQDKMPDLLRGADVFVLPTRLREGFPRSLLEAGACGLSMIATDQAPMRYLISSGGTGWLLKKPNTKALVAVMKEACLDPERTKQMGREARRVVEALPVGAADINKEFLALYLSDAPTSQKFDE